MKKFLVTKQLNNGLAGSVLLIIDRTDPNKQQLVGKICLSVAECIKMTIDNNSTDFVLNKTNDILINELNYKELYEITYDA